MSPSKIMLSQSFIACLLVIGATASSYSDVTLESVCKDKQVSLTKISATRKLIEQSRAGQKSEFCGKFRDAFDQLDDILATVQAGQICNLTFVDKVRNYHMGFIADASNKQRDNIPWALRQFFISLCFQISAECKMALINNLEYDTKERINDEDYQEIRNLEGLGATLLDSDTEIADFDDILLLNDLQSAVMATNAKANRDVAQNVADDTEEEGEASESGAPRVFIKVKTNNRMRQLVANCKNKFKPIYDKLIMPLIKLSNLGYNYQGELLERELKELRHNKLVRRWYNIVQTCEVFNTIEMFEDPNPVGTASSGSQALTFISQEEAQLLREQNVRTIEQEVESELVGGEKALAYEPIASHNDDELWIKDQRELDRLLAKYKASSSEADRVRSKLLRKLLAKVKESIMSGKVLMFASDFVKSNLRKEGGTGSELAKTNVNKEIVELMEETVGEESELAEEDEQVEAVDDSTGHQRILRGVKRKIVSRAGPKVPKSVLVPSKIKNIPIKHDGTKTSTKIMNWTRSFLPRRMDIFMWFLFIAGAIMVVIAIFAG